VPTMTVNRPHRPHRPHRGSAARARARRVVVAACFAAGLAGASVAPAADAATATTRRIGASAKPSTTKPSTTKPSTTKPSAEKPAAAKPATTTPTTRPAARQGRLRLGYFPNVTHAPAIAGVEGGFFAKALGPDVTFSTASFNAGPSAIEALNSGAIDATYIGPNPAVNAFVRSNGQAVRIVAGTTSGGAFLVVRPGIRGPEDLRGKKLATPQLGGTQDVALRYWLKTKGLNTTLEGGGDVSILPQENAQTLETFRSGAIDGAWVPEPWATRLILEAGAKVLVDERDLWRPSQSFTTTILIVRTDYLKDNPEIVRGLIEGQLAATEYIVNNPDKGQELVNAGIAKIAGRPLAKQTIASSWVNLTFTPDPEIATIRVAAEHAVQVGLLTKVDIDGIADLTILNGVLAAQGRKPVADR
jgi:NitT/TauT family transport system substrate-binding protein